MVFKTTKVKQANNQVNFLFEADKVKDFLLDNGISITKFAIIANISKGCALKVLNGKPCSLLTATKMKKALGGIGRNEV